MKFELNSLPRNCSKEEIITEIKRVDKIVDKDALTQQDFNKHGKISSSGIKNRFGDWQSALSSAGLGHKYAGLSQFVKARGKGLQKLTDEEILVELKRVAKILNKESITMEDLRNHSRIMWESVVVRRFESWAAGLEKAGLKISALGRRYSLEDYFENLLNVWTHYGRQPSYGEIDKTPSKISAGAYENRFGTWRKALETFVRKMNERELVSKQITQQEKPVINQTEIVKKSEKIEPRILAEDKREISLSLRYKVLSRDGFRCVRCGKSPATDLGVELHVDHKEPFSRQGKMILENLETKCRDCNLGKGNRHLE